MQFWVANKSNTRKRPGWTCYKGRCGCAVAFSLRWSLRGDGHRNWYWQRQWDLPLTLKELRMLALVQISERWRKRFTIWSNYNNQLVKGIMRTSGEIGFCFRLKLKITLVDLTYPSQRPQCPSLSPHFLLWIYIKIDILRFQSTDEKAPSTLIRIFLNSWLFYSRIRLPSTRIEGTRQRIRIF